MYTDTAVSKSLKQEVHRWIRAHRASDTDSLDCHMHKHSDLEGFEGFRDAAKNVDVARSGCMHRSIFDEITAQNAYRSGSIMVWRMLVKFQENPSVFSW
jgi:hypothetical protein